MSELDALLLAYRKRNDAAARGNSYFSDKRQAELLALLREYGRDTAMHDVDGVEQSELKAAYARLRREYSDMMEQHKKGVGQVWMLIVFVRELVKPKKQ